ncbi:MAG TPA: SAM-dependent methyltransferase [Acidimicrobiales bacterium]|nr:SAM-dependent methyltransferase [Acidimicrobiales bacterium]
MTRDAADVVAARIERLGPRPLSEVLDVALYEPGAGFYDRGGSAGRREGDFLTSPEVGPLFGAVVARALDTWWRAMGAPDPFLVVEAGAGPGTLARAVLHAEPDCAVALRYVLVERSPSQRRRHAAVVPLEEPSLVLPPVDADTGEPVPEAPPGPLLTSLAELPRVPGTSAVVLANELLDNLPFDLAERREGAWDEVRVGRAEHGFQETTVPLDESRSQLLDRLAPDAPDGARVPLQAAAGDWLRTALATAGPSGRVVVVDYAATTEELAKRPQDEWLRTYRAHAPGGAYLDALGNQDVTCEIAVDQLATVRPPTSDTAQHEWLRHHGIDDLVAEGKRLWTERAHVADLAAVAARSRISEAEALLDPTGLGAFRVLEWSHH